MKYAKTIYPAVFLTVFCAFNASAQDTPPKKAEEKAVTEEIEVVRPYKPILAEAVKLRRSPDLEKVQTYKAKFSYSVTDRKLELNSDIKKLQAEKLADERQSVLLNNYLKGAVGSLSTFMAEGYVNTGRDEALQAGAFFRHFSQNGKLDGQDESKQQLTIFGKSIMDKATLSGRINYQRHGLKFYGVDASSGLLNPALDKQNFNFIEAEGEIINKFTEDENALSYAAKVNGYIFSDKFKARENLITLSASLNKRINALNFGLGAGAELGKTSDLLTSTNNNVVRVNPYVKLQTNGIKITAGVNFVQEFGTHSISRLFPAATADLTVIPDFLQVYAEVNGDVKRTTLKELTDRNPFVGNNIQVENSVEKLNITAGIKGTAGPGFGYKVMVYSKKIGNMPLFVNHYGDPSRFDVIYDRGNTTITGIEGAIVVQVAESLTWTGKVNLEQYKPATETESWFNPPARVNSDLVYTYDKKFSFSASVYMQGDSKAKLYTATVSAPYINDKSIEIVTSVKGFVDLGVGANYKINNKFSAFANVNNLFNKNYTKYLYYPANGFNVFGGISYSF